eukprot:Protomagalhaensia_sp_Gyna_25__54@NODE_1026_length_2269_cov_325_415695_g818_i0_p1_GENE_NODE_1026_length_2269_cov_325_415695_g818_i0NODE_1026_length_2269_cov_325_415695_g818_i0_p1_ORF_typecomplete_len365_score32_51Flavokinase/PF01687_17/1_2e25HAD_2/PF13419_6/0_0025HAD/PF12710_7/0_081NT5C/PF06941_12/0_25_NODE_1026_length_2269_cov_325_415695_g818_i01891283
MLAVDFDHLVADAESLYSGAFKTIILCNQLETDKTLPSVFDEFAKFFSGREFTEHYANLLKAFHLAEQASQLVTRFRATCKPRPGALERLTELQRDNDELLLFTGDVPLSSAIWEAWANRSSQLKSLKCQIVHVTSLPLDIPTLTSIGVGEQLTTTSCESISRLVPRQNTPIFKVSPLANICPYTTSAAAWGEVIELPMQTVTGKVVSGFKRGSSALGIPTANVDSPLVFRTTNAPDAEPHHGSPVFPLPGTYLGRCIIDIDRTKPVVYNCIISIGWSSFFNNRSPTFEVYIYHEFEKEFYGATMITETFGIMRGDSKYSDFSELVAAIQLDCQAGLIWHKHHAVPFSTEIARVIKNGWSQLTR